MSRRVTIKDVAAHARVSYQTVSKVLNKQAQVSKETEERIWDAVRVLGYRPNVIARSLRSQRSKMIGYSWAPSPKDQGNSILDQFLQSMVQAGDAAGYQVLTFPHRPEGKWIDAYRELIDTNRVDGFVLSSVEYDDPRIQLLQELDFPFVAFGRSNSNWDIPYVDIDGSGGMCQVVEHLLAQGHRRIAALAWPEDSRVGNNRMEGFLGALKEAGITPPVEWVLRGEGVFQFGLEATSRLLSQPAGHLPSAIVAFNDFMAIGAMHAVQAKGLQVGKDIAVTGFDDVPLVQYMKPSLTSVRQPIWEVGQQVISMLLELLVDRKAVRKNVLLQPRLIIRGSSSLDIDA
jgi:DNA-binding LacI/PurR family transcriptional regulator